MLEEKYMLRAIELAKKGTGKTNPNPLVGAVVVKEGKIIAEGYHEKYGELHAERNALNHCSQSPEGATLYVTLEPCCHHGKTPPCTDIILEKQIKRVVIGSRDPNPLVAGGGARILREAGVEVIEDYMREECDAINPVFLHYIKEKMPYVALKYAMTLDGKIATNTGKSQWITGEEAREHVHELRNYYKGILVGINTVLKDDPMLTCRLPGGRNPVRIVCDTRLRIPLESKLVESAKDVPLIVATGIRQDKRKKAQKLIEKGVTVLFIPEKDEQIDMRELLKELGSLGIDGILVEGGGAIHGSLVRERLVNCVYGYIGASIFGGQGCGAVGGQGINEVDEALKLQNPKVTVFGNDVLVKYEVMR